MHDKHTLSATTRFPGGASTPAGLLSRLDEYFQVGGFWNPEYMEHDKVRQLLLDIREYFHESAD